MESRPKTHLQSISKGRKTMRVVTEQSKRSGRSSWKQNYQALPTSTTSPINNYTYKNKFVKCIFEDKYNILSPQKNCNLQKYFNLKAISEEKKKKIQLEKNLNRYMVKLFDKYKNRQKNLEALNQSISSGQQKPSQLYIQVKQVFKHLQILKNYGFSQKKITKWVSSYLSKKTQMIQDLFIKASLNKTSYSNTIIYERCTTLENIIKKMEKLADKLTQSEILFLINEIRSFKDYIEEIVIRMTQTNLDQIFNVGEINAGIKFEKENKKIVSPEVTNFMKDLKSIQDHYGQLNAVSKRNRAMFLQVSEAQQKFAKQFCKEKDND